MDKFDKSISMTQARLEFDWNSIDSLCSPLLSDNYNYIFHTTKKICNKKIYIFNLKE
jgi:hypothetical protein